MILVLRLRGGNLGSRSLLDISKWRFLGEIPDLQLKGKKIKKCTFWEEVMPKYTNR